MIALPGSITELILMAYPDLRAVVGLPGFILDAAKTKVEEKARRALGAFLLTVILAVFLYWLAEKKLEVF